VTARGQEAPTLHVNPKDTINIDLANRVPAKGAAGGAAMEMASNAVPVCGSAAMTDASVNMHFHGMNLAPTCHSDEVIHTLVNSRTTFRYTLHIPANEPPGLYWYHPHVHGLSSPAVQGVLRVSSKSRELQTCSRPWRGFPSDFLPSETSR